LDNFRQEYDRCQTDTRQLVGLMEGDAPWALGVMWTLTFIVFVFVILRLYTRVLIVKIFGVDDLVYNIAFVSRVRPY